MNKLELAIVSVIVAMTLLIGFNLALLSQPYRISNLATIKAVGVQVFRDRNATDLITFINWGFLEPNSSTTFTVYAKSTSNVPSTLTIYTQNWNPANASDYMSLTADPNNFLIQPSEIAQVNLTLTVASDVQGITAFSFDICFIGMG